MDRETRLDKSGNSDAEPSFAEIQRRISEIPDGPSDILNTPKPYRVLNAIGGVGVIVALLPMVLVKWMAPASWMITMMQIGMAMMFMMWLPPFVRSIGVLGWTLARWKTDMVIQLDHDHPHLQSILRWLATFPADALAERLRTVQLAERQIAAKLGLLAGGVDRLGFLPVLVSAYLFFRNWNQPLEVPAWQILLGVFLVLLYLISATGSMMRIRLRLFESMLSDSLAMKVAADSTDSRD